MFFSLDKTQIECLCRAIKCSLVFDWKYNKKEVNALEQSLAVYARVCISVLLLIDNIY